MVVKLGEYTVEIKAKRQKARFNRNDTIAFLNHLACMAWDAYDYNTAEGYESLAEENRKEAWALGDAYREMEGTI